MTFEYALSAIRNADLDWQMYPNGGFVAIMNGITIRITSNFLTLSKDFKSTTVHKPTKNLWNKQPTLLEKIFSEILQQASQKCIKYHDKEYEENLKNELIKQLLGL